MRKIILGALIISLCSCTKRVTCEGTLYSSHGIPIPNETVYFHVFGSPSSYPTSSTECSTDKDGNFYFFERVNKNYSMELECRCDSGSIRKSLGKPRDRTNIREDIIFK